MKAKAPMTRATAAAIVTAFCPEVNSEENRFRPSRARVNSVLGTRAMSELHVHDVGEGGDSFVHQGHRDLSLQRGLGGVDHGVGHAALTGRRLSLGRRSRGLTLLDLFDGVGDRA